MNKNCISCGNSFVITDEDLAMLKKISPILADRKYELPPPTHCPTCRFQRRMALRNENNLYHRMCDFSGERMVSLYAPDNPHRAYKEEVWWSDVWDPLDYGLELDLSRPFFDQFKDLRLQVPRRGMQQDGTAENSEYTTYGMGNKNCYLAFACAFCEDVYMSSWVLMGKDCMDCLGGTEAELLYECIDCFKCYHCYYCIQSTSCQDSYYLDNCMQCHHCIACKNLRNKGYHIWNQPVSKEEFERTKQEIHDGNFETYRQKFHEWQIDQPTQAVHMENSENCTGDNIKNAKNCHDCCGIIMGAEDFRHCQFAGWKGKDMMDCSMSGKEAELNYELMATATMHRCAFCMNMQNCSDVLYSDSCKNLQHCFGCIGLNHKKFCILNKQYTEEEYFDLVPKLIEHMSKTPYPSGASGAERETQEWGEHFPVAIAPFSYNESYAQEFLPLTKEEILKRGWRWQEEQEQDLQAEKVIPAEQLPRAIADVPDDILQWAIQCSKSGKLYKIIKPELEFYRRMNIPIPREHPRIRHYRRRECNTPPFLYTRNCPKCEQAFQSAYHPDRPELLYCDACFKAYVHDTDEATKDHELNQQTRHHMKTMYQSTKQKARTAAKLVKSKMKTSHG